MIKLDALQYFLRNLSNLWLDSLTPIRISISAYVILKQSSILADLLGEGVLLSSMMLDRVPSHASGDLHRLISIFVVYDQTMQETCSIGISSSCGIYISIIGNRGDMGLCRSSIPCRSLRALGYDHYIKIVIELSSIVSCFGLIQHVFIFIDNQYICLLACCLKLCCSQIGDLLSWISDDFGWMIVVLLQAEYHSMRIVWCDHNIFDVRI